MFQFLKTSVLCIVLIYSIVFCTVSTEFLDGYVDYLSDLNTTRHRVGSETYHSDSFVDPSYSKDISSRGDKIQEHSSDYNANSSSLFELNTSKLTENKTYSVTSPFGEEGQPLLSENTNNPKGYKTHPHSNTVSHPFEGPARYDTPWGLMGSSSNLPQSEYAGNYFWGPRRAEVGNFNRNNHEDAERMLMARQMSQENREQNQQLVRSILTEALDILTLGPSEKESECFNSDGFKIPCDSSDALDNKRKSKMKSGTRFVPCNRGGSCKNVLTYHDVFGQILQSGSFQQSSVNNEEKIPRSTRRVAIGRNSGLPQPRTRTVFRSVETSPTSSLARLLNSDDSISSSNSGNNYQDNGAGITSGGGNSGGSGGGGGGGSMSSHINGGGNGGSGGGGGSISISNSVEKDVFNKFAMETVSFEQQSASEIKRLDNLLRQLAMAAQTDFTSVSSSVNTLQQELVQTQQQLVQAWSILNATHVKDNSQTVGDLRDVKTDVYRLHALLTGATPLGQGTAHGRAAEVKEVATIGPGVDCAALYKSGVNTSGVYDLQPQPTDNRTRMTAFCDMETDGGGWTVFQRRKDGSDDFFRGWNSYKNGFGSYRHDHWLGLENIHLLTKYGDNVMRIELTDWDNKTQWAEFSYTRIMDESDGYRILVGGYRGNAGDPFHSLSYSMRMQSMRFSTFDSDNDLDSGGNCALTFTSGWWFNKCFQVNLNGVWYGNSRYAGPSMNGIVWDLWPEHFNGYSLKHTEMKLRPADFHNKK